MDFVFNCSECGQQLEVDSDAAGNQIDCPVCSKTITIPKHQPELVVAGSTVATSAEARIERHFSVPQHNDKADLLIEKPKPPLDVAAKETDKKTRIKTIKRGDCQEVGRDHFDENVAKFLAKLEEGELISIHPIQYSHTDLETRAQVVDFGIMIIYKG